MSSFDQNKQMQQRTGYDWVCRTQHLSSTLLRLRYVHAANSATDAATIVTFFIRRIWK
jgi:hypothetical protein